MCGSKVGFLLVVGVVLVQGWGKFWVRLREYTVVAIVRTDSTPDITLFQDPFISQYLTLFYFSVTGLQAFACLIQS